MHPRSVRFSKATVVSRSSVTPSKVNDSPSHNDINLVTSLGTGAVVVIRLNAQPLESIRASVEVPKGGGLGSSTSMQISSLVVGVGAKNLRCRILIESQVPVVKVSRYVPTKL